MPFKRLSLVMLSLWVMLPSGCATKQCLEEYSTLPMSRAIRRDGEILTALVEKHQATAEAIQASDEQSSERTDLVFSQQAWEMGIRLITQLQNLSRREEHAAALAEQRELVSNIRCMARGWGDQRGHIISTRAGQTMLRYQRELETEFGERGRPTDTQLTDIIDGRDIYMGPVEEDVDVPDDDEGTGPSDETPTEGEETEDEEGEGDDISSAVDDLLGE